MEGLQLEGFRDKNDCCMSGYSGYHIFKSSPTNYLLLADSEARYLEASNLNILSIPGDCIGHAYFIPQRREFENMILFLGGNDLFDGLESSLNSPRKVAQDLIELTNFVCQRTDNKVFVLEVPKRDKNLSEQVKLILFSKLKLKEKSPKIT